MTKELILAYRGARDNDSSDETESEQSTESEDDNDSDLDRRLFKYTVHGMFQGIDIYKDADQYILKSFYNQPSAEKYFGEIVKSILSACPPESGIDSGDWSLNTSVREGLMEQHLMIGTNVDVEARLWIEKKVVDLNKKAYRSAKARNRIQEKAMFAVHWENTVTPIIDDSEHQEQPVTDDQDRDLFGDDPLQVPQEPVTRTIPNDEIEYFTTAALANRKAKEIYLAWHFTFIPGLGNEGWRKLEDEAVEKDLEALGDWGLFSREESFCGLEEGTERKVEERMKVWVSRIQVFGPAN
jgi:hypothetical protein